MNGMEKPLRKIALKKQKTNCSTRTKKSQSRKRIFVQRPFSHYLKNRLRKFHVAKPLAFSLYFLYRSDQNH